MLTKLEVTNFKNFENDFIFDLTKTKSFEFNKECVYDGIIKKHLFMDIMGLENLI